MQADLICIGNELLTGLIENSNSGFLARRLWAMGIPVRESSVIADDEDAIGTALNRALDRSDLVILTGGLGPTDDDLTREAVASALGLQLIDNQLWIELLEAFFLERGVNMPENNRKQAKFIEGSKLLENKRGTAPGMIIERAGKAIILLPGPPHELQKMFDEDVLPFLKTINHGILTRVKTLKVFGLGESLLEEKIKELKNVNLPNISYVARGYEVDLQIKGSGESEAVRKSIEQSEKILRDLLGDYIFGSDDDTLSSLVANLFTQRNMTLSIAESCSGGLMSDLITDVPGSSKFYLGGLVAYSRAAKENLLGIKKDLLDLEGEVSEVTANKMAEGVRNLFKTDLGLGITGIAGPESDSSGSPVGLVYISVSSCKKLECKSFKFSGGRRAVKERASQIALNMLKIILQHQL